MNIFTDFITQLTTTPPPHPPSNIEHKWLKAMILEYN